MSFFRENLRRWVTGLLAKDKSCLSASTGRLVMTKVYKKYFKSLGSLDEKTLQRLSRGTPVDPETIKIFADVLKIKVIDRTELFIRWGECRVNRYAYAPSDHQMRAFIRSWSDLPYQTVQELQIEPIVRIVPPSGRSPLRLFTSLVAGTQFSH